MNYLRKFDDWVEEKNITIEMDGYTSPFKQFHQFLTTTIEEVRAEERVIIQLDNSAIKKLGLKKDIQKAVLKGERNRIISQIRDEVKCETIEEIKDIVKNEYDEIFINQEDFIKRLEEIDVRR